ncbi:MAG: hypothetical protein M1816_002390 [Peltula sp. TS41687]|nr:MAG: hypothetical protein M1816_002390 [Peltula sp. TS41687]
MVAFTASLVPSLIGLWLVRASFLPRSLPHKVNVLSKRIDAFGGRDGPTVDLPSDGHAVVMKGIKDAQNKGSQGRINDVPSSDLPQWVGKGPAPDWATPGPENPGGNPYYPDIDYPKPPDGDDFDDCKRLCLDWVRSTLCTTLGESMLTVNYRSNYTRMNSLGSMIRKCILSKNFGLYTAFDDVRSYIHAIILEYSYQERNSQQETLLEE